jgi:hypothetical protein
MNRMSRVVAGHGASKRRATTIVFTAAGAIVIQIALADDVSLEPLAFLAGHCWEGEFADGGGVDRHCFEWMYDGRFLRDRHVVSGQRGPYQGETIYRIDATAERIVYHYYDSTGGYSTGEVIPSDGALRFPDERYEQDGTELLLRTVWRRVGTDELAAVTEERQADGWREAWRIDYRRVTP